MIYSHAQKRIKDITLSGHSKVMSMYAYFPTGVIVQENGSLVEIQHLLGEKHTRRV